MNRGGLPICFAALFATFAALDGPVVASEAETYDVVIYGGTSAAVTAAVQAVKMNRKVVIVCLDKHLGGLSNGGLGYTDTGNKAVIGGLAREFYHRVWKHYAADDAWNWQKREEYGNKGQGTPAIDGANRTMWIFEPHAAEQVFDDFISEYRIPVHREEWLDRDSGVKTADGKITEIRSLGGKRFRFEGKISRAGRYAIRVVYTPHSNRATNIPVTIEASGQKRSITLNQTRKPDVDNVWMTLGTIAADAGDTIVVTISNRGTNGYVVIDAVQFLLQ